MALGLGSWVLECWGLGVLRLVTFVASLIVNFVETHGGEIDKAWDKAYDKEGATLFNFVVNLIASLVELSMGESTKSTTRFTTKRLESWGMMESK